MDFKNSRKRSMHKQSKKFLAGFLAVLLTVCMLPVDLFGVSAAVYAAEEQETLVPEEETGVAAATDDKFTEEDAETASDVVTETLETESDETQAVETDVAEEEITETEVSSEEEIGATETGETDVSEDAEDAESTETVTDEADVYAEDDGQQGTVHILDASTLTIESNDLVENKVIDTYYTLLATSKKKNKISTFSGIAGNKNVANIPESEAGKVVVGLTGGGLNKGATGYPFTGIGDDTDVYGPSIAFKSASKKTKVVVKFTPKNSKNYVTVATASKKLTDVVYSIDELDVLTDTIGYTAASTKVYTETFTLIGEAGTNYYIGFDSNGGVIMSVEVTELPVLPAEELSTATVELSKSGVDGWDASDSSTWKAPYVDGKIMPTVKISTSRGIVTSDNYKLLYARKVGDTEPEETDYKEASDESLDLTSLGMIYVKAVATTDNLDYTGETKPVAYEIVKGIVSVVEAKSYVADISQATEEEKTNDSLNQTVDLKDIFPLESKYGTATFKNARVEDGDTENNVLAANPDVQLTGSVLTFKTKANAPSGDQIKATIKISAEFENYEDAELTLEVELAEKKTVTIEGIVVEKTYDGTAVVPSTENLVIKADGQEITDTALKSSLIYTYAAKDGTVLDEAPKDAGEYTLTASVPLNNASYTGESAEVAFTIEKATLIITSKDRKWIIGYPSPSDTPVYDGEDNSWYQVEGLAAGDTLETLGAEVKFAYLIGETPVTDWAALTETDTIVIVPTLVHEGNFSNYEEAVVAVNGSLTIEKEESLSDNEHELNFTKDWVVSNKKFFYKGQENVVTDGYFTVGGEPKATGASNSYPMISYGKYESSLKMNSSGKISFKAEKDSELKLIIHIQSNEATLKLNNDTIITGTTPADKTIKVVKLGKGVAVPPYDISTVKDKTFEIYEITMPLTAGGEYAIARGKGEFQIYYAKVTEPKTTSDDNEQYTVTFKNGADTFKTETVASGTELSLSDIKPADQAGKVFKGWAAKENATAADVVTSITPTEDTTLYAVWVNVYTITLKNGDQTVGTPVTVEAGESYTLPKLEDTDTEYFMGWKNADTTDTEVYEASITPTKDTILNAYFKNKADAKFYAVTIDYGYKENEADDNNKKEIIRKEYTTDGEEVTVTLDELGTPVRAGYTFDKWMAGDAEVPAEGLKIKADITITAIWTKNSTVAEKYAVIFADTAGNKVVTTDVLDKAGNKVNPAEVEKDTTILLPDTTEKKEGYIWTWTTEDKKEYKAGAEYIVTGNVTFTGDWVKEGDDTPTDPEVKTIKLSECEIAVPSIIADAKKNPKNESKTSVVYYTDKDKDGNPINPVRFAEGLDFTVEYKIKADNVYTATIQGAGRTVDQYRLDTAPENNVVKEYKIYTKNDKNVIDLSKAKVVLDGTEKTAVYTGYGITPEVKSVKVGKTDIPSTQYKVSYKSNVNAGKASVIITADSDAQNEGGNFVIGSKTVTFTIKKAAINKKQVTVTAKDKKGKVFGSEEYAYRGIDEVRIAELSVVSSGGRKLRENIDYTVSYKNNRKAGKATATIKGIGNNISGSVNIPFTIKELSFAEYKEYAPLYGLEYSPNGAKVQYMCVFKTQGDEILDMIVLEEGVDFKGSYKYEDRNKKAGTEVTFSGKAINACKGIFTEAKFPIGQAQFDGSVEVDGQILVDVTKSDLTGANLQKALEKAVVVKDYFGIKMKPKKDYVIEPNEANGTVAIKPSEAIKGNYLEEHQSITCSYEKAKNIAKLKDVSFSKNYTLYYDGRNPVELGAREIAEIGNYQFVLGRDVEIVEGSYKNNYKAGNASVTIRGINGSGFYGQKVLKFKIVEK